MREYDLRRIVEILGEVEHVGPLLDILAYFKAILMPC